LVELWKTSRLGAIARILRPFLIIDLFKGDSFCCP
jgi:hypothetical protein